MFWPKGAMSANIIVFPYQLYRWLLLFCPKRSCQTKTLEMVCVISGLLPLHYNWRIIIDATLLIFNNGAKNVAKYEFAFVRCYAALF